MDHPATPDPENQIQATPPNESGTVLSLGIEVHRLTACLMEPIKDRYRLAAWWSNPSGPQRSVAEQIQDLLERFGKQIHRQLWDQNRDAPFTTSMDPVSYPPLQHISLAASPRPQLRVWVAALTRHGSLTAVNRALEASQAQVVGSTVLHSGIDHHALVRELNATQPEVLILAGGYESDEASGHKALLMLSHRVAAALQQLPNDYVPEIIFAGNSHAYQEITAVLNVGPHRTIRQVSNVLPEPGLAHAQALSQAIDDLYWQKCQRTRDFSKLEGWHTGSDPIMTVESSFARLVQLWAAANELPELYSIYTGSDRWLHVWADEQSDRIVARYSAPGLPTEIASWHPPVRLVSGPWLNDAALPESVLWWDRIGIAPIVASSAPTSPKAAIETLREDVLIRRDS